jgi:hypothetical protein
MKKAIISICILLIVPRVASGQSDACPPKDEDALQKLESYLGDEAWKEARQEVGISVPPSEIRVLTDSQDTEVCRKLSDQYGKQAKDRFFFEVGPYYFVIYQGREDSRPTSPTPIFILDKDLEVVHIYL